MQDDTLTAYDAFFQVVSDKEFSMMEESDVLDQFLQRIDYTRDAVVTLAEYKRGQLNEYKRQLDEYYMLTPVMAFIPRALWPEKPLQDLGAVLYYELTGIKGNSITPSQVVVTYIWGGWPGLIFISVIWGMLCTVGGQIIIDNKSSIYKHAPFIILAIALSQSPSIMAEYFINSARLIIFIYILYKFGVIRRVRSSSRHKYHQRHTVS